MVNKRNLQILNLVKTICGSTISINDYYAEEIIKPEEPGGEVIRDLPVDETYVYAEALLRLMGVNKDYEIYEIPLCWNNQVVIRFILNELNINTVFNVFAGINKNNNNEFILEIGVENEWDVIPLYSESCLIEKE